MKNQKYLFVLGISLFLIAFVLAASTATDLIFNNNVTSSYDEGAFFVNWTAGGDVAANYSIYVFSNNSFYLKADNDSVTGYSFSQPGSYPVTLRVEEIFDPLYFFDFLTMLLAAILAC